MAGRTPGKGLAIAAGVLLAWSVPGAADVKAGVDAWSRGDYAQAVREWKDPAAKGDADAQFNLAQAYRLGRGVDADAKQAEALYARAAAQGHLRAADNYGLLLFQDGRRADALPYVAAAAERGDPRAQYLLGIAHFNGDLVAKDWRRAYALLTLANSAGLPQAAPALAQMDEHVPAADRQAAQTLAATLRTQAENARQRELASADLAIASDPVARPLPAPAQVAIVSTTPTPALAGADFTLRNAVAAPVAKAPQAVAPARAVASSQAASRWKLQLGAFGVAGNAERLWTQLASRPELRGRTRLTPQSGRLTRLLAGGFASKAEADSACAALKASGQACLVVEK